MELARCSIPLLSGVGGGATIAIVVVAPSVLLLISTSQAI